MAHPNIDERRSMVGKVLDAGIQIGSREAKVLGVVFNCSQSAIAADVKALHGADSGSPHHLLESGPADEPARDIDSIIPRVKFGS